MTKQEFEHHAEIRKLIEKLTQKLDAHRAEAQRVTWKIEGEIEDLRARCKHPFTKRGTAESDTYCEICGADV